MPDHNVIAERAFERILLIKPSSLGDCVHALPVLRGLRRRYPNARLAWLINRSLADLVQRHPDLDEVIPFDRARFGRMGRSLSSWRAFRVFLRELRRRRFDLVVDLQGLFRSGFLAWTSGAGTRIGPSDAREMAGCFYTHRVPRLPEATHAVDRNLAVGRLLGFADAAPAMDLHVCAAEREEAARLLESAGVGADERYAAFFPAARWETKQWLADRFSSVADRVAGELGMRVVLMGGPGEASRCTEIARGCVHPVVNLAGRTGLRALIALIERSAVVLCHDSAPMHFAVALGRPMVACLGPTHPSRTGPYGRLPDVLRRDLACSPCYLRRLSRCPHQHRCMTELSVEMVMARLRTAV